MFVYVINKNGQPLMPCKPQKARKLLKTNKAEVIKYLRVNSGLFEVCVKKVLLY